MSFSDLKARIVSGSFWAITGELIAGGARGLSYLVYARLLSPTDFGLVGFAVLVITLFPLLIDNSLSIALMRYPANEQRVQSTLFFLNVALAILAMAVLCAIAPGAAAFLHDRRVTTLLPILSVQLLLNSLCSVHIAYARQRFQYRRVVPVRLASSACSIAMGIPLAFLGYGYWSLVAGSLGAAIGQLVAARALLDWRPQWGFDWSVARSLSGFSSWVAVDMAVTWMLMSGGGFFLAFYLGAHDLGLFRLSDRIDTYLLGSLFNPLIPVLYGSFCEVLGQRNGSWRIFERSVKALTPISLAIAGAVVVAAGPLESMIGGRWSGVAGVIALNAIADGISYTTLGVPSLLRAHGLAKTVAIMRMVSVGAQIVVYMIVAPHGLLAFLYGKLGLEVAIYAGSFVVLRAALGQPILKLLRDQMFQALLVGFFTVVGVFTATRCAALGEPVALTAGLLVLCVPLGALLLFAQRDVLTTVYQRWVAAR
jgi:O-antigen/teichoic acid export membrane protein